MHQIVVCLYDFSRHVCRHIDVFDSVHGEYGVDIYHRLHCFKAGYISNTEGGQIHLNFITVLWSP